MPDLVTVILTSGVVATLMGGVVGGLLGHVLTRRRDELAFRREKLEALYMHVERFGNTLFGAYLPKVYAMKGHATLEAAQRRTSEVLKRKSDPGRDYLQMTMIVNIYFPRLREALQSFLGSRDTLSEVERAFKNDDGARPSAARADELLRAMNAMDGAARVLQRAIVHEATVLNPGRWRARRWPWRRARTRRELTGVAQ